MKNLKVAHKIFALSFALIIVFSLTVGWVYTQLKSNLNHAKQSEIKHTVDGVWGVIDHYATLHKNGTMTLDEAQTAAKDAVRHTRFADGNYFWIQDTSPTMVMHPIKPKLDGKNLSSFADPNGKKLFVEMSRVATTSGHGFVDYQWAKPGSDKPVDKISFVKLQRDWGWIIGGGLYLDDIQAELDSIFYKVIAAVSIVVVLALILMVIISRGISGPLGRAVHMLSELENGRLALRMNLQQNDEIGQMANTIDKFADSLQNDVVASLKKLAQGDLSFDVTPHGDDDEIRGTLHSLSHDLNDIMSRILVAGDEIASAAGQVADSSQSLSQGATEQAASMEQISASMHETSSQTNLNAENATQATILSEQNKQDAESGSSQMQTMVSAMAEINDASQNISKIIKTIDEIAFQTNLLALNAAVEAARAGQHGKGFAVVAEEVRNLAARSAKAAAETTDLIEGSVQKVANGSEIAHKTARALDEIVTGVGKVTDLIAEITAASKEQATGIAETNQGIAQIDSVTQQNTANAEESAAAAEEMSGQAAQLHHMLQRFTLRQQPAKLQRSTPVRKQQTTGQNPASTASPSQPQISLDDSDWGKY
ncbi:MAG: methyl-accepting chemotaxis protein [Thermodesulfobacteriota bacterium]|nr:methyl-accepting chemotaxis protein [Thermodesulfobacteriota bacterium]